MSDCVLFALLHLHIHEFVETLKCPVKLLARVAHHDPHLPANALVHDFEGQNVPNAKLLCHAAVCALFENN